MALLLLVGLAVAQQTPAEAFAAARSAERSGQPAVEWEACTQVVAQEGPERDRRACEARLAWLETRRGADGSWRVLETLEAARRGEGATGLEALLDHPETPPVVRREGLLWLVGRAGQPAEVVALTEGALGPLDAPGSRKLAQARAVALARLGRVEEARALEAAIAAPTSARPQEGVALVLRQDRARRLSALSWGALGAWGLVLLSGLAVARAMPAPRRLARGLGVSLAVSLPAVVVVGLWDPSLLPGLPLVVGALATVHLGSAVVLWNLPLGWPRSLGRVVSALAALGATWLSLQAAGLAGVLGL